MSLLLLLYSYLSITHSLPLATSMSLFLAPSLHLAVPEGGRAPATLVADGVPRQQQLATSSLLG